MKLQQFQVLVYTAGAVPGFQLTVNYTVDARTPQELREKLEQLHGPLPEVRKIISGDFKGGVAMHGKETVYVKRAA